MVAALILSCVVFTLFSSDIFVTSNDGANWTQIISNLTNLRARTVSVKDNLIFVGTEGSGVFSRPQ